MLDALSDDKEQRVYSKLSQSDFLGLTVDGVTDVNARGVYNIMACTPLPFLLGVLRLGAAPASASNLLASVNGALPPFLTAPTLQAGNGRGLNFRRPRLQELCRRVLWGMCTDNASVMVSMRKLAECQGLVLLSYSCFAHVSNLIGKDLCRQPYIVSSLRAVVTAVVFFRRYTRAHAALQRDRATQAPAGHRTRQLASFSETRWVGQSQTVRTFLSNLPGLRQVLLANGHDNQGFLVPPAVSTAINDGAIEAVLTAFSPCLELLVRVSASLEADASFLSAVIGLFSGFRIVLRGTHSDLLVELRCFLSSAVVSRFSACSHFILVLAF